MRKDNPFPSDGDAAKIPRFTDFLICLREDREEKISTIIVPLLERANTGETRGSHDALIVGEIGRGKTHLLKFLEKKVSGKRVSLVSHSLKIPNYINILPIYVKFDASMTVRPEMFVYFFLNYLLGYGVENLGLLNSPVLKGFRSQLKETVEELYKKRMGQDIGRPMTIAAQHALSLMYDVFEEALNLVGKRSILLLLDELEGIILTAERQREKSLILVMDFFRQFHDSINQEEVSPVNVYAAYAMTAPAFDRAQQARQESSAWLSRLKSQVIEIPQFSEEELICLVSCALENDDLSDTDPFDLDALTYIYRSIMGMPRFAIEALHNSYGLYLEENLPKIGSREIFRSTAWLNPVEVVDSGKIAKLKGELGQRYAYLIQVFSDLIEKSTISQSTLIDRSRKIVHSNELSKEQMVEDLRKFADLGYVEISEDDEAIKVLQSFYNRILKEPEREEVKRIEVIDPAQFIAGSSETALAQVKIGKISDEERVNRLREALDRILKQLFAEEGITFQKLPDGWRLYETRRSPRGAYIKLLTKSFVNSTVTQAEIVGHLEETRANAVLFLHDFDDVSEEQRATRKLKDMVLPEPYRWVKELFRDSLDRIPETWSSSRQIEVVSSHLTLSEISIFQPVSYGRRSFTPRGRKSNQVLIDVRGLWYSITEMGRTLDPEHAQLLDTTLKYVIQDFFGPLRKGIIDKSSVQPKRIDSLLRYDKKSLTVTRSLMKEKRCHQAISKQQIVFFDDLPPGANPRNMNRLCESGLFSRVSEESWKANSLNDAQRLNPWIRFIVYNSTMGKSMVQITKDAANTKLGPYKETVLSCLKFYSDLLKTLGLMENDQVVLVDNKALLLQSVQRIRKRFSSLKEKELFGAEQVLDKYCEKVDQVEAESKKIGKTARTDLEADNMYSTCLEELGSLSTEIQELIKETREKADTRQRELAETLEQVEKEQEMAIAICDSLDFNRTDSAIVSALMKVPKVKRYVLEIQLSLTRPRMLDSLLEQKHTLDERLSEGFLMKFLSDCELFEKNLSEAVTESREIEGDVKKAVDDYLKKISTNYERLLDISKDFSPGPKAEISETVGASLRHLSNEEYVESLLTAGKARLLLTDYAHNIWENVNVVTREKKDDLTSRLRRQKSYLRNSTLLLGRKAPKSDKSIYTRLEEESNTISKEVDVFDELPELDLSEKSVSEIADKVLNIVEKTTSKGQRIEESIDLLNDEILRINRSSFKGSFVKVLKFISEFGSIDSLNYSEFVKTVGNKIEAEKAIIDLIELGLVSLDLVVTK